MCVCVDVARSGREKTSLKPRTCPGRSEVRNSSDFTRGDFSLRGGGGRERERVANAMIAAAFAAAHLRPVRKKWMQPRLARPPRKRGLDITLLNLSNNRGTLLLDRTRRGGSLIAVESARR